jgi:hypothetical protein
MRKITEHIVAGDPEGHQLTIEVIDSPGAGGACHEYSVRLRIAAGQKNALRSGTSVLVEGSETTFELCRLSFQNGPIREAGVNGVTNEILLAVVIDRLRCFQGGLYPSPHNAAALAHCEDALMELQHRTRDRIKRGVEGKTEA